MARFKLLFVLLCDHRYDTLIVAVNRLISIKQNGTEDFNHGLYWNYEESIDLDKSSMIDQIFNGNFDDLEEEIKQDILESYSHGNVELAYQIWLTARDNI